ncbi:MAG: sporulation protein YabP [Bacilli bacterium]|nr:sporulation protein YabP [Bacilli bacterium]
MNQSDFYNKTTRETNTNFKSHHMFIRDRKSIELTGITKIESLNSEEFILETILGYMTLSGQELEMINFSVEKGEMLITGYVTKVEYYDHEDNEKASKGFFSKLFK